MELGSTATKPAQPPPIPIAPQPLPPPIEIKPALTQSSEQTPLGNSLKALLDVTKAEDAQRVQQRLAELGTYSGDVNGIWSLQAQQALNDFQLANGLPRIRVLNMEAQKRLFVRTAVRVSATNVVTYTGEWTRSECRQENASDRFVTTITTRRAEASGTICEFNSIERESAAWRIRAKCTGDNQTWNANIRLLRAGNRLIWSSERGIATYVQCIGAR